MNDRRSTTPDDTKLHHSGTALSTQTSFRRRVTMNEAISELFKKKVLEGLPGNKQDQQSVNETAKQLREELKEYELDEFQILIQIIEEYKRRKRFELVVRNLMNKALHMGVRNESQKSLAAEEESGLDDHIEPCHKG